MTDYTVLFFEECERCKQFDKKYKHKSCGFDIEQKDGIAIQTYECSKCSFTWIKEFKFEDSSNN